WFELLTDRPAAEIAALTDPQQTHPMQAKERLGKEIVGFYYGDGAATEAAEEWRRRFSQRQDPSAIPEVVVSETDLTNGTIWICKLLVSAGLAKSNNEARRLVGPQSGVSIGAEREKITDPTANIPVTDGLILRVGNRRVVRVRL